MGEIQQSLNQLYNPLYNAFQEAKKTGETDASNAISLDAIRKIKDTFRKLQTIITTDSTVNITNELKVIDNLQTAIGKKTETKTYLYDSSKLTTVWNRIWHWVKRGFYHNKRCYFDIKDIRVSDLSNIQQRITIRPPSPQTKEPTTLPPPTAGATPVLTTPKVPPKEGMPQTPKAAEPEQKLTTAAIQKVFATTLEQPSLPRAKEEDSGSALTAQENPPTTAAVAQAPQKASEAIQVPVNKPFQTFQLSPAAAQTTPSPISRYNALVKSVNTSYFLGTEIPDTRAQNLQAAQLLTQKSTSKDPMTSGDWETAARAFIGCIRQDPTNQKLLKSATDLVLQFYLQHTQKAHLPSAMAQLFQGLFSSKTNPLQPLLQYALTSEQHLSTHQDPNGALSLDHIKAEFQGSCSQPDPIELEELGPTNKLFKRTDFTSAQPLKNSLKDLNLRLLFTLSSHNFNDEGMKEYKKKFLQELILIAQNTAAYLPTPQTDSEAKQIRNFLKLYGFFLDSNFAKKANNRFTIWGDAIGNKRAEFTTKDMISCLNAAKEHERTCRKVHQTGPLQLPQPVSSNPLPLPELSSAQNTWEELAGDSPMTAQKWQQRQLTARQLSDTIEQAFDENFHPPIDFQALVRYIQLSPSNNVQTLMSTLSPHDNGLTLLRDYVYPYCVAQRVTQTQFESPDRRFVQAAASPKNICELGGKRPDEQCVALQNVLHLMGPGGGLSSSVIRYDQIDMLQKMTAAMNAVGGKSVYICNETGSGKTTMAKLATQIVALPVPAVLHVAPFPQQEWPPLENWEQLRTQSPSPLHFSVTASDLSRLLSKAIPNDVQQLAQETLFLLDEYDNDSYHTTTRTVQEQLALDYGCRKIVNMSATPNLETFDSLIARWSEKLAATQNPEDQEKYTTKIAECTRRKEQLITAMSKEFARGLVCTPLTGDESTDQQLSQIFEHMKLGPTLGGGASILIELPGITIPPEGVDAKATEHIVERMKTKIEASLQNRPSALLLRDSKGRITARLRSANGRWEQPIPLEAFKERYSTVQPPPVVICLYSQDSVGGDFGIFSTDRMVRAQYVVYTGGVVPNYLMYQHLRRLRTSGIQKSGQQPPIPTTIFLGSKALRSLSNPPQPIEQQFIAQAYQEGQRISKIMEQNRLDLKKVRKKRALLASVLEHDKRAILKRVQLLVAPCGISAEHIEATMTALLQRATMVSVSPDDNVETLRRKVLTSVIDAIEPQALIPKTSTEKLQHLYTCRTMYELLVEGRAIQHTTASGEAATTEETAVPPNPRNIIINNFSRIFKQHLGTGSCIQILHTFLWKNGLPQISVEDLTQLFEEFESRKNTWAVPLLNTDVLSLPRSSPTGLPDLLVKQLLRVASTGDEERRAGQFATFLFKQKRDYDETMRTQKATVDRLTSGLNALKAALLDTLQATSSPIFPPISELVATDKKTARTQQKVDWYTKKRETIA